MTYVVASSLAIAAAIALPAPAAATVACKQYTAFHIGSETPRAGTACAANADDYPDFVGHGHVGRVVLGGGCHSVFPLDAGDAAPTGCSVLAPYPIWVWSRWGWRSGTISSGQSPAYIYPMASGWRWAWIDAIGWTAAPSRDVYVHWFYPLPLTAVAPPA